MLKKIAIVTIIAAMMFSFTLFADDDYKVIKNAVNKNKSNKISDEEFDSMMFVIHAKSLSTNKPKAKIKIPVILITAIQEQCPDEHINFNNNKKIEFRKLVELLKTKGIKSIVEITDEDEDVHLRIWVE